MTIFCRLTKLLLAITAGITLAACQSWVTQPPLLYLDAELQQCIDLAHEFEQAVSESHANNAGVSSVARLPFLATNRFHSALAKQAETPAQIEEWVQMSVSLGIEFRSYENRDLVLPWPDNKLAQLGSCAQMFASSSHYLNQRQQAVSEHPAYNDNYSTLPQWLGLLPMLRPVFKAQIDKLHREEKRWFAEDQKFDSALVYGLHNQSTVPPYGLEEWFNQSYAASPLRLPRLSDSQLAMLFELHAPQFEIETLANRDKLGTPGFVNSRTAVDTASAVAYTLPSYTRFGGQNLLQLNYVVWFPERGPVRPIDLFAGKVDSLIWRVTFDETGQVLLYDSIHSCGCYHKYFLASDKVRARQPALSAEPANLIRLVDLNPNQGLRLIVSSNEHYIVGLEPLKQNAEIDYALAEYSALFAVPNGAGNKSWFGPTGIIKGSERLERFTLWPTGIESVGAMRQWGAHATGFVERQHFDDATGFDSYLILD
jgi:hypothetical protein